MLKVFDSKEELTESSEGEQYDWSSEVQVDGAGTKAVLLLG